MLGGDPMLEREPRAGTGLAGRATGIVAPAQDGGAAVGGAPRDLGRAGDGHDPRVRHARFVG